MSFRNICLSFMAGFLMLLPAMAGDIAEPLKSGDFWKQPVSETIGNFPYAPVDENTIRIPRGPSLTIGQLSFGETLLEMDENKTPTTMTIMVYNKGDDGDVSKAEFDNHVKKSIECLDGIFGVPGKTVKVSKKETGLEVSARQWVWEGGAARLEYASSGGGKAKKTPKTLSGKPRTQTAEPAPFQPEFVRLKIGPNVESLERGGASDAIAKSKLRGNVKKTGNACVIEGIPMVDQGQKGYCVPATLSRLFAYYGMDGVDQHALAALCKSSGDGGTSMASMETALKDISSKFHIKLQKIPAKTILKDYNKTAKKIGKPEMSQQQLDLGYPYETDVLKAMMDAKNANAILKKWMSPITKSIDSGIPVVWSVMLGIYPEPGVPQSGGGHMRMIIGYDWDTQEIIFSDSWGKGHECKRMPMKQAFVITHALYILKR